MFMGEYSHTLDSKGRLSIPARFREQLGTVFILSKGIETCLTIYTKEEWEKLTDRLLNKPDLTNSRARRLNRFLFSGSIDCETDKSGRILIPANFRAYASLEKEVIVAGVGAKIEIWDRQAWEDYNDYDDMEGLADSLEV